MYKQVQAKVHKETKEGTYFLVLVPRESLTDEVKKLSDTEVLTGEFRIDDGRILTAEQRKKAYAMIKDIAFWLGYMPEEAKEIMKYWYISKTGADYFSLSNCSVTNAKQFISFLIDFAFEYGVELEKDTAINRTDDINAAIYSSLKHKSCILCGADGEMHHVDRVGVGNNRNKISHLGMEVMCLCRKHHNECHSIGQKVFDEKYKVYGIKANEEICNIYGIIFNQ